jgi:C-terminal processing protease CtpA/Prc
MSITDALQRLRGEVGTSVGISVRRDSTGDTVDVVVVRATIAH